MPFVLLLAGVVLVMSGVRDTTSDLAKLLKGDLEGKDNFGYWFASIMVIGAIGYIKEFQPLSRMFLVLVIVVLFVTHRNVFEEFNAQAFQASGTGPLASGSGTGSSSGAQISTGTSEGNSISAPFSIPLIHPLG